MTAHKNLWHNGYEEVADHIKRSIRKQGGVNSVVIHNRGRVRIYAKNRLPDDQVYDLIGTYTPSVPVEHIEDDLLAFMRERVPA